MAEALLNSGDMAVLARNFGLRSPVLACPKSPSLMKRSLRYGIDRSTVGVKEKFDDIEKSDLIVCLDDYIGESLSAQEVLNMLLEGPQNSKNTWIIGTQV